MGVIRGPGRSVLSLLGLLVLLAPACSDCPLVSQTVRVDQPDPELTVSLAACAAGPFTGRACTPSSPPDAGVSCECRAACTRVLALIDQFPQQEKLESCRLLAAPEGPDAGVGATIQLSYRICR